jgi:hypothetical protein
MNTSASRYTSGSIVPDIRIPCTVCLECLPPSEEAGSNSDHHCIANRCCATVKLPFPLTPQFKSMLQSGVGTRDLDVRWVSSLSWYFLTLFGLQPVYNFILGSNNGVYLPFVYPNTS